MAKPRHGLTSVFFIRLNRCNVLSLRLLWAMTRSRNRTYSRYTQHALNLLGSLLRASRIERKVSTQALAERAGISRDLLYRIEKGDPRCEIGVVFELAAI